MSDANLRQIRVLHIVSAGGIPSSLQQSLFMPLLTRLPRPRVKAQVACLSPGAVPSAVLRQSGVPTFDLALSRNRFSPGAIKELLEATRQFRPDVIQAWGHTAQIVSSFIRKRCDWKPRLVWSIAETTPLAKNAGMIDRQKLKYAARFSSRADRIVYTSESAASQHRRVGFPDGEHVMIPPGVDATRFKPDFDARRKLREQLNLPGETFVIGMLAPFQPEYDHSSLIKAIGELVKTNPNVALVLAGHGVQKGNAPLMALVGGGSMATRAHLLGEWSDISALYNACDVVCSSALTDQSRMNLVMAMLCGVPCVATGMGAQGEVIGNHGVAIEPGSSSAFVKGINRVMQLTPEKRTHMAQGARKHALANYVYVRSLQKYLQLYYDLIGRQSLVTQDMPAPEIDATLTVPPALPSEAEMSAKRKPAAVVDLSDPDSLESKVTERTPEDLPKWRMEQEEERNKREAEVAAKVAATKTSGDVLQVFESEIAKPAAGASAMTERARGVADDSEELLSQDLLESDAPAPPRVSTAPSGARKSTANAPAAAAPQVDAAKQAALKAARMAALQPIASKPKAAAAKPASVSPVAAKTSPPTIPIAASKTAPLTVPLPPPPAVFDASSTQPLEMLSEAAIMQAATPIAAKAVGGKPVDAKLVDAKLLEAKPVDVKFGDAKLIEAKPVDTKVVDARAVDAMLVEAKLVDVKPVDAGPAHSQPVDTKLVGGKPVDTKLVEAKLEKIDLGMTQPLEMLSQAAVISAVAAVPLDAMDPANPPTIDISATQPMELPALTERAVASPAPVTAPVVETSASAILAAPLFTESFAAAVEEIPAAPVLKATPPPQVVPAPVIAPAAEPAPSAEFELSLMATGAWAAAPRTATDTKSEPAASPAELNGPETLSLIAGKSAESVAVSSSEPTLELALLPEATAEPKRVANGE